MPILTKSTEDWIAQSDGLRLFVTRYWPRGHTRDECDEWLPNLAPSESLLKAYQAGQLTWSQFRRDYRHEMLKGFADESDFNSRMRNSGQKYTLRFLQLIARNRKLTLICTCPYDTTHCHRFLLKELLEGKI